jgi:hypothetical protein
MNPSKRIQWEHPRLMGQRLQRRRQAERWQGWYHRLRRWAGQLLGVSPLVHQWLACRPVAGYGRPARFSARSPCSRDAA